MVQLFNPILGHIFNENPQSRFIAMNTQLSKTILITPTSREQVSLRRIRYEHRVELSHYILKTK